MDPHLAAPFRQQLLAQQSALLAQLAEQRGGVIGRAEAAADHFGQPEDPRAQLATERELEFALDERETAHLAAVVAALTRIEAGTYASAPIAVPISPQPACTPHPRPRAACTARKRPSSTAGQPEQSFFSPLLYFKKAFS